MHSVRVRITLAAVLVTAVAVGTAGWLLVRSVEDTQLAEVRDDIEDSLDQVAARLEQGADPQEALETTSSAGFGLLQVTDERGQVVASFPTFVQGGRTVGRTALGRRSRPGDRGGRGPARAPRQRRGAAGCRPGRRRADGRDGRCRRRGGRAPRTDQPYGRHAFRPAHGDRGGTGRSGRPQRRRPARDAGDRPAGPRRARCCGRLGAGRAGAAAGRCHPRRGGRDHGIDDAPASPRARHQRRGRPPGPHHERHARSAGHQRRPGSDSSSPTPPTSCAAPSPPSAPASRWRAARATVPTGRPSPTPPSPRKRGWKHSSTTCCCSPPMTRTAQRTSVRPRWTSVRSTTAEARRPRRVPVDVVHWPDGDHSARGRRRTVASSPAP